MTIRPPANSLEVQLLQYLEIGEQEKQLKKRKEDIKKGLLGIIENDEDLKADSHGHLNHFFPDIIMFMGKEYLGFQKQRKVSQSFNEDKAEEILQELGIDEDQYISYTSYVDQDKIARLYALDQLTEEQMSSMIEEYESWAFVPVKA